MKILIISIIVITIGVAGIFTSYALDSSVDTSKQKKTDKEKTLQQKKTLEGGEVSEVSIDLYTLYLPTLLELEKSDERFRECKIISKPKLLKDFNLTSEIRPGIYDTIKAQILKDAGESNSPVSQFTDDNSIRLYRDCLALYGAIIGQASKLLKEDIGKINSTIGKEDIQTLSDISIQKISGFDDTISQLYLSIIRDDTPCVFNGSPNNIMCGNSMIVISSKPTLSLNQTEIYGTKFFGYSGTIKISESSKKTKESVQTIKKNFTETKEAKQSISPSKFLPQP
ncbi:MAG: hypothetical protein HZA00_11160 [Nitrospinae bacterium]|nr:hypothetical protein [Nitrospinota bacterium]